MLLRKWAPMAGFCAFLLLLAPISQKVCAQDSAAKESRIAQMNRTLGRGINLGNCLEADAEGAWGVTLKPSYFAAIKKAGFDTVRLPIKWSAHAKKEAPFTIDPVFAARVDWAIEQALKNRLNIIVNIHRHGEMDQNPEGELPRLLSLWEQIATRYRGQPKQVYLELLNEPHDKLTNEKWNDVLAKVLAVVRKSHPERPVIVGPGSWNAIWALDKLQLPREDDNLIVTVHFYDPFEFTHQDAPWAPESKKWKGRTWKGTEPEKAAIRKSLEKAAAWGKAQKRPIFLGEFGAYEAADLESRALWTAFIEDEAQSLGFSRAYWEFCSGFGAYDPKTDQWKPKLLSALIHP